MKRTRALTNYVDHLEREEDELRYQLLSPSNILDGEVTWVFPDGIDLDDKEDVEKFLSFIIAVKANPLRGIGSLFRVAKTDIDDLLKEREKTDLSDLSEKDREIRIAVGKAMIEDQKKNVEEWLEKCQKKTRLPREEFIRVYESKYEYLMNEYEELIALLRMLKE